MRRDDIYGGLAKHQQVEMWFGQQLVATLQEWGERLNREFKLDVPEYAIRIDYLARHCYGHFRYGHNGFGLKGEIAINAHYLEEERQLWEILGTLLHELLHGWQQAYGKPGKGNHHNSQFRLKAAEFGLLIDGQGVTLYLAESPFTRLLREQGIYVPPASEMPSDDEEPDKVKVLPQGKRVRGQSKMKKWTCSCGTNIRCAVPNLHAQCLSCGQLFQLQM